MGSPPGHDKTEAISGESIEVPSPVATRFEVPELDAAGTHKQPSAQATPDVVGTQFALPDLVLPPTHDPPRLEEPKAIPRPRKGWVTAAAVGGIALLGGGITLKLLANATQSPPPPEPSGPGGARTPPAPIPPNAPPSVATTAALARPPGPAVTTSAVPPTMRGPAPTTCPQGMAGIPGGEFVMLGQPVIVTGYCLDLTEVTVDAYANCVESKACTEPKPHGMKRGDWEQFCNWKNPGRGRHPVNGIDWNQAVAYCTFEHKRLPTQRSGSGLHETAATGRPTLGGRSRPHVSF